MAIGPDTYRIQAAAHGTLTGGSMTAQKAALEEANSYCAQQGRQFVVIGFYDNYRDDGSALALLLNTSGDSYQVDFRCLSPGDPGLLRPTPIPASNIVIQDQRRG